MSTRPSRTSINITINFDMANFEQFYPILAICEGKLSDDPRDPGGYTMMGITWATFYKAVTSGLISYPLTKQGLASISKEDVKKITKIWYWDVVKGDQINDQKVANSLADAVFNTGRWGAILMQRALNKLGNNLTVDGIIGDISLNAINKTNSKELLKEFNDMRRQYYKAINQPHFLQGQMNRVNRYE